MKTSSTLHPILTLALSLCALAPTLASAQTTTETITGDFKSTDGNSGTYVNTITTDGATKTERIVFTRTSDGAISTDSRTAVKNSDHTRSVTYSHTDFGATAAFTSQKVVTREKHGQFIGKGTYTTATGDTGTLSTLESQAGSDNVVSEIDNSPTTGITQTLRLHEDVIGFHVVKTLSLAPDGTLTTVVNTRFVTGKDSTDDNDDE